MTHIWVPKAKILEGEFGFKSGKIAGEYTLKKYKAGTDELIQTVGPFKNLITDFGLNQPGTRAFGNYCGVGTGTTPPTVADTALGNRVGEITLQSAPGGSWNTAILRGGPPDYWVQGSGTWRFNPGEATGTLTEVGIGHSRSNTVPPYTPPYFFDVSSRALIVDSTGNPISITVLPDEYLDVTYSLRWYPYIGPDVTQTLTLSGVNYTVVTRPLGLTTLSYSSVSARHSMNLQRLPTVYSGTAPATPPQLAAVTDTAMLTGGSNTQLSMAADPYVNNSLTRTAKYTAGLAEGNLAYGIRGLTTHLAGSTPNGTFINSLFQSTITPAIPKDSTKILQFGVSMSWSRY